MDNLVTLSAVELERLLITIESSQQVHRRHQYFLWSQGVLQSFLPHDMLIFGHGEYGAPGFRCEVLARANDFLSDRAHNKEIDRLIELMVESWRAGGHLPCLFNASAGEGAGCAIGKTLGRLGLGHALAHGAKEFPGESSGFFVFMRMPEQPGRRHAYFAEMLMPYLHTTLHRMLISEKDGAESRPHTSHKLSIREAQVIGLIRDGKTNQQVAEVLDLSPLTVKNHVQNILRKLDVANRAQAVAKAVKARLIGDQPGT
jgi:transcriptional regulator EpsA